MKARVTMADIAREAGVHQTTVSLALRGHTSIPPHTQERIRLTAEHLGYRPNPLISALISERRRKKPSGYGSTLAFLNAHKEKHNWQHSHNYKVVYKALCRYAGERGYRVEEFWLTEPGMTSRHMRKILLSRGIRGIIVCPLPSDMHTLDFDFSDFAAAAIGYTLRSPALDHVSADYYSIMQLVIRNLSELGHKRISFVTSPTTNQRVNHLSLGAFLAEKYSNPSQGLLDPLIINLRDKPAIFQWLEMLKPDAVITAVHAEYCIMKDYVSTLRTVISEPLLCVVDARAETSDTGVIQNLERKARAIVHLVTSRVERAEFGPVISPQTILVQGTWRYNAQASHPAA
ncbi:MAG: LacI family DNA-binding transcriptional regulator [Candidatus Methylacidiphilales bacterium]|nr:LacI family DNA-binding transcriptional regulator [Candidatus Methylacidiphilales bacterium]